MIRDWVICFNIGRHLNYVAKLSKKVEPPHKKIGRRARSCAEHELVSKLTIIHSVGGMGEHIGGPAQVISSLCEATERLSVHNILVTTDYDNLVLPSEDLGVEVKLLPAIRNPWIQTRQFIEVVNGLVGHKMGVLIHNHGLWLPANHAAAVVARRTKIPMINSLHGMLMPWARKYRRIKKNIAWTLYQKRDLQSASVVHVSSEVENRSFVNFGLKIPTAIAPFGIDVPPPTTSSIEKQKVLLFLGRIHPIKGLLDLVEAWSRVRPIGWRVVIAGADLMGHGTVVREAAQSRSVAADFEFPGPIFGEQKWQLYRSSSAFVLPSYTENFGVVVPEALICGLPVITTTGTPWQELTDEGCGWWVSPGVDGLSVAIREMTELSNNQRVEMGLRGKQLVERSYLWSSVARRMVEIYHRGVGWPLDPDTVVSGMREGRNSGPIE